MLVYIYNVVHTQAREEKRTERQRETETERDREREREGGLTE